MAVLALALLLTLLVTVLTLNWLGTMSLMVPVNVPGPLLPTTMVKLVVPPITRLLEPTTLVTPSVTALLTVPSALALLLPLLLVPAGTKTLTVLV